jgi:23S rRNA C2498 (ribose-2'-O)-methylase RlmM
VTARPRYYAELNATQWQLAPASDQTYQVVVHFVQRPQSIVTAGSTWLGNWCGDLLFHASLMEAEDYVKADDRFDDIKNRYDEKLQIARVEMRNQIRQGDYSPAKATASTVQE